MSINKKPLDARGQTPGEKLNHLMGSLSGIPEDAQVIKHVDELLECLKERLRGKARLAAEVARWDTQPPEDARSRMFLRKMSKLDVGGHVWTLQDVAHLRWFDGLYKTMPEAIENAFALWVVKNIPEDWETNREKTACVVETTFWELLAGLRELAVMS
jgi:hypothetical protein